MSYKFKMATDGHYMQKLNFLNENKHKQIRALYLQTLRLGCFDARTGHSGLG